MIKIVKVVALLATLLLSYVTHSTTVDESTWPLLLEEKINEVMEQHTELNPLFWQQEQLDPTIQKKLQRIGTIYFHEIVRAIPGVKLKDILFIGGMANYFYNSDSDIDIHLLIDTSNLSYSDDFINHYLIYINKYWSTKKIMLSNYRIELGAYTDSNSAGGIYSILTNQWLTPPTRATINFSKETLKGVVEQHHHELMQLQDAYAMFPTTFDCAKFTRFLGDMSRSRSEGLRREGLTSIENFAYRVMRNLHELESASNAYLECAYG